jgi:hypothetical protein
MRKKETNKKENMVCEFLPGRERLKRYKSYNRWSPVFCISVAGSFLSEDGTFSPSIQRTEFILKCMFQSSLYKDDASRTSGKFEPL